MKTEWLHALYGGMLIGVAASLMLFFSGRVAGISGMIYGLISGKKGGLWYFSFLCGLIAGGSALYLVPNVEVFSGGLPTPDWSVVVAGLLVGFGTSLGSGCTSGHGVCGISRLSLRSILATGLFVFAGIVSVFIFRKIGILP
jgi:uncharacterized protein